MSTHAPHAATLADDQPPIVAAARAFIDIGGRLMINPNGGLEYAIDAGMVHHPDTPQRVRNKVDSFVRQMRDEREANRLIAIVQQEGVQETSGWIVLEGIA